MTVRLRELSEGHRRLLADLASRISTRLDASFVELSNDDDDRIGVSLREGDRSVVVELSLGLLAQAMTDSTSRETLRIRLKARRDRMMFRTPPRRLPKFIPPLMGSGPPPGGGWGRGRR